MQNQLGQDTEGFKGTGIILFLFLIEDVVSVLLFSAVWQNALPVFSIGYPVLLNFRLIKGVKENAEDEYYSYSE